MGLGLDLGLSADHVCPSVRGQAVHPILLLPSRHTVPVGHGKSRRRPGVETLVAADVQWSAGIQKIVMMGGDGTRVKRRVHGGETGLDIRAGGAGGVWCESVDMPGFGGCLLVMACAVHDVAELGSTCTRRTVTFEHGSSKGRQA